MISVPAPQRLPLAAPNAGTLGAVRFVWSPKVPKLRAEHPVEGVSVCREGVQHPAVDSTASHTKAETYG